jgi:hypothetical protein
MGAKNSSATRVRPIFNELLGHWPTGDSWLSDLCSLAMHTHPTARFAD